MTPVLTFDLFSALLDSRAGGAAAFSRIASRYGWPVDGTALYDRWDALNKAAQRDCREWVPYPDLAREALAAAYAELGVGGPGSSGDVGSDLDEILASVSDWPLWPDVADGLPRLARRYRVGLLSNVDDDIFARTRAAPLVDDEVVLTSQRLGVYKPDARIYHRARERLGDMVHVATSARDVRGASEAGIPFVRLRRPGHALDPAGGRPEREACSIDELETELDRLSEDSDA